ncbi:MAG TPA: dienelactone hydrolase family protein, partial [Vicinamibacteria bacterium]
MKSRLSLIAAIVLAVASLALAGPARAGEETVSYKSGEETISGLLVTPAGPGPHPAVIVIQEWWGLNDWVKEQARALGKEGYVALAVDLYRGKVADKQEDAHQLMMGAPPDRIQRDLKAAFAWLAARKDVKASKIGSIGWCMGGRWTM